MPPDAEPNDRPDEGMDRRRFVKTAVGAATFAAVGASGASIVVPLSTSGRLNIRRFPYIGARRVLGPAPQGIPLIPLQVNAAGLVEGVPKLEGAAVEHSLEWYRYCGHDESPAFDPGFTDDNVLRYFNNPAKVQKAAQELGQPLWYAQKLNQPIRADDFTEVGRGAPFRWRSEKLEGNDIVTGILVKVDPGELKGEDVKPFMAKSREDLPEPDLVAFSSYCAHFCCVPGYQESKIPLGKDLFDMIYCTCHDSVYNPRMMKKYLFPPNL